MESSGSVKVLIALTDMFFMSRIQTALPAAPGLEPVWMEAGQSIAEQVASLRPALVLVDLQDPNLKPIEEIMRLSPSEREGVEVVGFMPHVRMDLREGAKKAGFDRILTRSAFITLLPEILRGAAHVVSP